MRNIIIDSILAKMEVDEDIYFLTADMGINLVEKIEEKFPARYANVGIAEQNLIGVAAGLANLGYKPFVYTISNFAIHRCFEQIRNDIVLHDYPVTIMGTSTGYDNAPLGPTHHIIDDWGALKDIPGIDIYCPGTVHYARTIVDKVLQRSKPAYIRIPKGDFKVPESDSDMVLVEGIKKENLLVSYGSPAQVCLNVRVKQPETSVLVFNRLKPFDDKDLKNILQQYKSIIVVEDHFGTSGLYGSLCEFCARHSVASTISSIAPENYEFKVGKSKEYYFSEYGITEDHILHSLKR